MVLLASTALRRHRVEGSWKAAPVLGGRSQTARIRTTLRGVGLVDEPEDDGQAVSSHLLENGSQKRLCKVRRRHAPVVAESAFISYEHQDNARRGTVLGRIRPDPANDLLHQPVLEPLPLLVLVEELAAILTRALQTNPMQDVEELSLS